jgi:hypothetical protein
MANYKVIDADKLDSDLTNIADAIRGKAETNTKYNIEDMPTAIAGIEAGGAYEGLWDTVTNNGTRGDYLFYSCAVDADMLSYIDLSHATSANFMFANTTMSGNINIRLHDATSANGMFTNAINRSGEVNIIVDSALNCEAMFNNAQIKRITVNAPVATSISRICYGARGGLTEQVEIHVPEATTIQEAFRDYNVIGTDNVECALIIDAPKATSCFWAFQNSRKVKSIFMSNTSNCTNWTSTFSAPSLESLTGNLQFITGVVANTFNSPNLVEFTPTVIACDFPITSAKKLSLESAKNIINALVDYSGTENEFIYTVSLSEETQALLEAEGATAPNGKTWLE